MSETPFDWSPEPRSGCLAAALGSAVLVVFTPWVLLIQSCRAWRRGRDIRFGIEVGASRRPGYARLDVHLDVPRNAEPGFRRRLTDAVVRAAEVLRSADDIYHMVYRLPSGTAPVALPVGPQLQELGDRFSLVSSQGALSGRTVVWLALPRGRALSEVLDPLTYDPEAVGQPEGLLENGDVLWGFASEWADIGPSLVIRLIVIVPAAQADRIRDLLSLFVGSSPIVK